MKNNGSGNPNKTGAMAPSGGGGGNITKSNEMRADTAKTVSHGNPFPSGLGNANPVKH